MVARERFQIALAVAGLIPIILIYRVFLGLGLALLCLPKGTSGWCGSIADAPTDAGEGASLSLPLTPTMGTIVRVEATHRRDAASPRRNGIASLVADTGLGATHR